MGDYSNLSVPETLCPIGALCKVCGVTRRMVLNYEELGLLQPISVAKNSGRRYYGAQSVARVRHIKSLQALGLSLEEIGRFMAGDEATVAAHLNQLLALRENLDYQIDRVRALLTPPGDFTVRRTTLPGGDFAAATEYCKTSRERFTFLWRFTARLLEKGWRVADNAQLIAVLYLDPADPDFTRCTALWTLMAPTEESVHLDETQALYVNVKGPYERLFTAIGILRQYAAEHGLRDSGTVRFVFLSSPQSHPDPENYVTQVFLPILPQA